MSFFDPVSLSSDWKRPFVSLSVNGRLGPFVSIDSKDGNPTFAAEANTAMLCVEADILVGHLDSRAAG